MCGADAAVALSATEFLAGRPPIQDTVDATPAEVIAFWETALTAPSLCGALNQHVPPPRGEGSTIVFCLTRVPPRRVAACAEGTKRRHTEAEKC